MGKKKGGGGKKEGGGQQQQAQQPQGQQQRQQPQQQQQQQLQVQQQRQQQQPPTQPRDISQDFPSLGGGGASGGRGGGAWNRGGRGGQGPPQQGEGPQQFQSDRGRGGRGGGRGRGDGQQSGHDYPQHGDGPQQFQADRGRGGRGRGRGQGDGVSSGHDYPQLGDGPQQFQADRGRGGRGRGRGQGDGASSGHDYPQLGGRGDHGVQEHYPNRGRGGQGGGRGRGAPPGLDHPQQAQDFPSPPSSVHSDASGGSRGGRGGGGDRGGRGRGSGAPTQAPPPQMQPQRPVAPPTQAADDAFSDVSCDSSSSAQVTSSMASLQLSSQSSTSTGNGKRGLWPIPERKKKVDKNNMVGTRGRVIPIEVNHLLLTLRNTGIAYHYDCDFKPDVPKKLLRRAMEEMRKKYYPQRHPAFDGRKNLYSCGELPFNGQVRDTVQVNDEERDKPKEFDVTIKLVSTVDMGQISGYLNNGVGFPQDAIQALDIVLRNPSTIRFTPVGRSFFSRPPNQIINLGDGLELWYGFYQSAILGWRPFLNVDVAHKGFPEPKCLLDVMLDVKAKNCRYNDPRPTLKDLATQGLQKWELEDFNKFIKGLKVMYMIPNQPNTRRVYKMNGIKEPCMKQRFKLDDGRMITIGEYYEREKKYKLRFPHLNSIHVGSTAKDVCVPPELCTIVQGQVVNRKLNENQTAAMVKAAARPADERKQRIMTAMRQAGFNTDPCINEFGVTVAQEFQKINARVLNPPALEYAGNNKVRARAGVWRAAQFVSSNRLERWVVMTLSGRGNEGQLRDFAKTMAQQGRSLGMNIAEPYKYAVVCNEANLRNVNGMALQRIIQPYFEQYKRDNAQLVVVVIPDRPPEAYSKVKLTAETTVGLLTQCIKERTMSRMNPATAGNILLKLNAKLNGVNHTVDRSFCPHIMDAPTMLVGADVTHPSPDQTTIPSVAAVAASHDRRAFQYNMVWRLQPPREEIILDLQQIMREQLMFFYQRTKQKPLRVIFYRDGVSEGQFSHVLEREMSAIRQACSSLQADYQPRVTFLVVQKRHHTRFFPTRAEDEDGKNRNVPPGTIVDTVITHPKEMDFYLVSHASLQGTSRPTKYHKLWDENDIDEDDLEELTYYLCHLFSRCTRSVSYPAPTYYAHLAAFRGRVYLEGSAINLTNLPQEMNLRKIKEDFLKNFPMFFV